MKYLIIYTDCSVFYTNWYEYENNWSDQVYMVIRLETGFYTIDGFDWNEIPEDNL